MGAAALARFGAVPSLNCGSGGSGELRARLRTLMAVCPRASGAVGVFLSPSRSSLRAAASETCGLQVCSSLDLVVWAFRCCSGGGKSLVCVLRPQRCCVKWVGRAPLLLFFSCRVNDMGRGTLIPEPAASTLLGCEVLRGRAGAGRPLAAVGVGLAHQGASFVGGEEP